MSTVERHRFGWYSIDAEHVIHVKDLAGSDSFDQCYRLVFRHPESKLEQHVGVVVS